MNASTPAGDPLAQWEEHLKSHTSRQNFDMDDASDLTALENYPVFRGALESLDKIIRPVFNRADDEALKHQASHRLIARITASTGAAAIVAACIQLGFTRHESTPAWVLTAEIAAVFLCLIAIISGVLAARQDKWLIGRNVAERCRHLKFYALTRKELWCGNKSAWEEWLGTEADKLERVSSRKHLFEWVADDPLSDPPAEMADCASAGSEAGALACYYHHKRVQYQRDFFQDRTERHHTSKHRLHRVPGICFWTSIAAVLVHFALEIWASRIGNESLRSTVEMISRWFIVVAAAAPAIGAGVRTWLLAFEFGRSALLYRAQRSNLDKRLEALRMNSVPTLFASIWFTEQALEQEHRAWIRLMLEAEWFG